MKLSATRISSFLRCKKKYWFQYEEHIPKVSNPAFKLGTACHEALELAGKIWAEKGKFDKEDYDKVFDEYNKVSIKEGIEELDVHSMGKDLVKTRMDNFALGTKIISLEETFGFNTGKNKDLKTSLGVPLIGAMDKVVEFDKDTLVVVDYKTSKTVPTAEQLKEDLQLSLYDLVASILFPEYKRIILCLDMLKTEPIYSYRTLEQRQEFNKYLLEVYKQMKALKSKDAKASLNMFCPWCDFKEYCKEYKNASSRTDYDFLPIMKLSDDELISEYEQVSRTAKMLDARKRELNMVIMEKIKHTGEDLLGSDKQAYIRQNARTNYDSRGISELVSYEDFVSMANLNKKAVDSFCAKNPQIKKEIAKQSTTNYTSPFLATRKIKN